MDIDSRSHLVASLALLLASVALIFIGLDTARPLFYVGSFFAGVSLSEIVSAIQIARRIKKLS